MPSILCRLAGAVSAVMLLSSPLAAQSDYPNRPIELVIPYGAGGGNDLTARVMSSVAADYLGQPFIIRIRPGAGSVVGLSEVARSKPDGYTLGWPGPHALVISAFNEVPIDFLNDLIPIAQMVEWQWFLVVPADSPYNSLEEFLEFSKANPGEIVMANSGNLAIGHLPALELESMAGVEFTHLPFDGGGPANSSVLSGDADAVHGVPPAIIPQVEVGNFKVLAVTGKQRHPALPDVPTYEELGYPIQTAVVVGIVAPAGTPQEVVDFVEEAMQKISEDKTYKNILARMGEKPDYLNSEDFRKKLEGYQSSAKEIAKKLKEAGVIQ